MDQSALIRALKDQLTLLDSAVSVLQESFTRVELIFNKMPKKLTIEQRESCEALTARFARLCDFLFQRLFRTIDQIELVDEGTAIDRLNRMEKRRVIESASQWRILRDLRNDIVHEYLIESSDQVLKEVFIKTPILVETASRLKRYIVLRKYSD